MPASSASAISTSSSRPRGRGQREQLVEVPLVHDLFLERERRAALVGERRVGDRPSLRSGPPTRWSAGTNTSSRNTSLNSASPVIWRSGRMSMPSACMSTTRYEMPRCLGASSSGVVRARQMPHRAWRGVRRPHLLAGEQPAAVHRRGARRQRREVAARARLAEQLAPQLAGIEDRSAATAASARRCRGPAASDRRG